MLEKRSFYINGSWVDPKEQKDIEVINPATEKVCAVISSGSKADVNDAVLAAKEAFKTWGYSTKEERIALLETFYTLYKNFFFLAFLETILSLCFCKQIS